MFSQLAGTCVQLLSRHGHLPFRVLLQEGSTAVHRLLGASGSPHSSHTVCDFRSQFPLPPRPIRAMSKRPLTLQASLDVLHPALAPHELTDTSPPPPSHSRTGTSSPLFFNSLPVDCPLDSPSFESSFLDSLPSFSLWDSQTFDVRPSLCLEATPIAAPPESLRPKLAIFSPSHLLRLAPNKFASATSRYVCPVAGCGRSYR